MKRLFSLLLLLSIMITGVAVAEKDQTFTSKEFTYSIPAGWATKQTGDSNMHYAKEAGSIADGLIQATVTSLNVKDIDMSKETDAYVLLDAVVSGTSAPDIKSEHINIQGCYGIRFTYTETLNDKSVAREAVYLLHKGNVFTLNVFYSVDRTKEQQALFDKVVQSIQVSTTTALRIKEDYKSFTRSETMRVGESAFFSMSGNNVIMTLTEVISGKKAAQMVNDANQFNDKPKKGQQYYIAVFDIAISGGDANAKVTFSKYTFDAVTKAGKVLKDTGSVAGLDDTLELFPGASGSLQIPVLADANEAPSLLFKEVIWVDLAQ